MLDQLKAAAKAFVAAVVATIAVETPLLVAAATSVTTQIIAGAGAFITGFLATYATKNTPKP